MKTKMRYLLIGAMVALTANFAFATGVTEGTEDEQQQLVLDSANYVEYAGAVRDAENGEPLVFVTIGLKGDNTGTITNSDGDFIIKVPKDMNQGILSFSHLGYKSKEIELSEITDKNALVVNMVKEPLSLREIVVRDTDPRELVRQAFEKIPENYSLSPEMQTAFYRETIRKNKGYVSVSEAVFDVYKSPYDKTGENDRIKILKARKSVDYKKLDTLVFKLQGGPVTSYMLDVVKNPNNLFSDEMHSFYNFSLNSFTKIDDHICYVINFKPRASYDFPIYRGKLYIDTENLGIVGLEFSMSEMILDNATQYFIRKKPAKYKVQVEGADYLVRYKKAGEKWYFSHVRSNIEFKIRRRGWIFSNSFNSLFEMAVTDRSDEKIERFKFREMAKLNDILADNVEAFRDDNFWGDYNLIKPDQSIEQAIEKLSGKLSRE